MSAAEPLACPYCDAELNAHALSCRACGRDLVPVLPLLRRIGALEAKLADLQGAVESRAALPAPESVLALPAPDAAEERPEPVPVSGRRRLRPLLIGYVAMIATHYAVVIGLDLPLSVLRALSIVIPFGVGIAYFGERLRLRWLDTFVAIGFAAACVLSMNAVLGWIDTTPILPQDAAGWRETFFYGLSIGASMLAGMLLRMSKAALATRGLTSIPRLREGVLAVNKNVPMDTLKAIELTVLMVGTALSTVTGLVAGLFGVFR